MGGIKSSFIVVSREIKIGEKIGGIIYTCFNQIAFSFFTSHSPQQLFLIAIAQSNRP